MYSAYSKRKEQIFELATDLQKTLKVKRHGDVKICIELDAKVKQMMLMRSQAQKVKTNIDFQVEPDLEINSDFGEEKLQSYFEKLKVQKTKRPIGKSNCLKEETHNGNILRKFKVIGSESYICQICHHY